VNGYQFVLAVARVALRRVCAYAVCVVTTVCDHPTPCASVTGTWSLHEVTKYLNIMPPPIIPKWSGLQSDFSDWRNNMVDAMEGDGDKSGLTSASLLLGVAQDLHDGAAAGVLKQDTVAPPKRV